MLAVALHGQLLQIGGKAFQVLFVRQHSDGLRAEEVVVPDANRPISTGRLRSNGAVRKCSSISWKPSEHGAEIVRPDGDHGGKADGRIHRITAADPVPETEHVGGVDAELRHFLGIGRDRDKMLRDGRLVARQPRQQPAPARCARWSWFRAW